MPSTGSVTTGKGTDVTINGEDRGIHGVPLVASHEASEVTRERLIGCMGCVVATVLGAFVMVLCCAGFELIRRFW